MRKLFLSLLLACPMLLVSCDQTANAPAPEAPTAQSAEKLRENNIALLKNLKLLKGQIEARGAARVAARSAAGTEDELVPTPDFGIVKAQVRTSLEASGACKPWIDFVVGLFDLLEKIISADTSEWTEAQYQAWESDLMDLFSRALSCLEPLLADVTGEQEPDAFALMGSLQSFDKCICGSAGGSIFGSSAALVYGPYGLPTTGSGYQAPGSPAGDTYSAPGSPAGDTYGAPKLFQ